MTKRSGGGEGSTSVDVAQARCAHCGRPLHSGGGVGRPRRYCRRSCRQRAFEARRLAGDLAWSDDRLVGMAAELAELEDRLDRIVDGLDELRADVEDGRCQDPREAVRRMEAVLEEPSP